MKDDGGAAFPTETGWVKSYKGTVEVSSPIYHKGMSLRDYFAGQALIGYMASGGIAFFKLDEKGREAFAKDNYDIADAMLAERAKGE